MQHIRQELRRRLRRARADIDAAEQVAAAAQIAPRIASVLGQFTNVGLGSTVAGYVPSGGEIDPSPALAELAGADWQVVLPVCGPHASMEFCPWKSGDPLAPNKYNIGEPATSPVSISNIDVVLVPGVGFDRAGSRIGHGVGYYDRFFARCFDIDHHPVRIGLAHDIQIVEHLEQEPWDVPMNAIVTPTQEVMIAQR